MKKTKWTLAAELDFYDISCTVCRCINTVLVLLSNDSAWTHSEILSLTRIRMSPGRYDDAHKQTPWGLFTE